MPHIVVTQAAALKVQSLIADESEQDLKLRVYVMGGGCSGFQYGFAFEPLAASDDFIFHRSLSSDATAEVAAAGLGNVDTLQVGNEHITVLIDMMSIQYLQSAEIDYQEDVNGARFVIRNPNAKTTCGCGSSFSA